MHSHYINKLLDLEDIIVKNIIQADNYVKIFLETTPKEHICPCCGAFTKRIHDYRKQLVKDLPFQLKHCYLVLNKRRYICKCGKRFYESYDFLPKYFHRTSRLTAYIANEFSNVQSLKAIAKRSNVSSSTVSRILDTISYSRPKLSDSISIDEFRGNTNGEKFQCILVDPKTHRILDILKDRRQSHLISYFKDIPKPERYRVKYFVCDMWNPYIELAHIYFPNADVIIDKYHFIRQVTWAVENVRKRVQKTMIPSKRKYFKRSHKLITSRYTHLSEDNKHACNLMLSYSNDLRSAHFLKEWFYYICQSNQYSYQRKAFRDWISNAESCGIKEFEDCANTFRHYTKEILNAFKHNLTNGPTEGHNNKIKVIKRISYGVKDFNRFRTRILSNSN